MRVSRVFYLAMVVVLSTGATGGPTASHRSGYRVKSLKVTTLSTMLAEEGTGEWGFAALVEADGRADLRRRKLGDEVGVDQVEGGLERHADGERRPEARHLPAQTTFDDAAQSVAV